MEIIEKQWGTETILQATKQYIVKKLEINSGFNTSYHIHKKNHETWCIISGIGVAMVDGDMIDIRAGSLVHIEPHSMHQIMAKEDLVILETTGPAKNDIERMKKKTDDKKLVEDFHANRRSRN